MTHHAFLYRAPNITREQVEPYVALLNASEVGFVERDTFGIDDVRLLTNMAYHTPGVGDSLGIVVLVKNITIEAEQALLKLLEEPPVTTNFLFCVPESVFLLNTLLSRFNLVDSQSVQTITSAFSSFLKLPITTRINFVGERITAKDIKWQQDIKQGLIAYLVITRRELSSIVLETLYYVSEHLLTRGASNKQLLEELAFTLPYNGG